MVTKNPVRIWIQSCSAGGDEVWGVYQAALKAHASRIIRPDTEVEFHGVQATLAGIDYLQSAEHLASLEVVRNAIAAEESGFDAFVMISTIDAGRREVRELIELPSVFITECGAHFAAHFGGRFGFLTHNKGILNEMEGMVADYGLGPRLVRGGCLDLTYQDFHSLYGNPGPVLEAFASAAHKVVERGATMLLPAGNPINMFFVDQGVTQLSGAPVIDIFGLAVKTAEMLVEMRRVGLGRTRRPATEEQRARLRAQYVPASMSSRPASF